MRLWRRKPQPGLIEARRERAKAEHRLAEEHEHVIIPLRELREKNHVSEAISMIIQRRIEREVTGDG